MIFTSNGDEGLEYFLRTALPFFFILIYITTIAVSLTNYLDHQPFLMGDWLINYQSGFIRRGFIGEISYQLSAFFKINPAVFIIIFQNIFYGLFFLYSFLIFKKIKYLTPYTLLIFSPFIFMFQLNDFGGGFRKEIIYFSFLAITVFSFITYDINKFNKILSCLLLLFPLAILTHEMLAIFLPYIVAVFFIGNKINRHSLIRIGILVIPSCLVFLFVISIEITTTDVQVIFNSLMKLDYPIKGGAISWLDKDMGYAFDLTLDSKLNSWIIKMFLLTGALSLLAFLPIFSFLEEVLKNKYSLSLIVISLMGTIALMFIAIDWGRFIYIHFVSIMMLSLIYSYKSNTRFRVTYGSRNILLSTVFFLAYTLCWYIPHISGRPYVTQISDLNIFSIPRAYTNLYRGL